MQSIDELHSKQSSSGDILPQHFIDGVKSLLSCINNVFNRLFHMGSSLHNGKILLVYLCIRKVTKAALVIIEVVSKMYIFILIKRVTFYSEAYRKISEAQSGFRAVYFIAFVDFQKAFDSVDISTLFEIIRKNGIKCKLLTSISSIYSLVKVCVRSGNLLSDLFSCPIGLRQGCKLSPKSFVLFYE